MSYTTITFLIFLPAAGLLYYIVPKRIQWTVLLAASLAFYILTCGKMTVFLLAATAVIYAAGLALGRLDRSFDSRKKELDRAAKKELKKKTDSKKRAVVLVSVILMVLMIFCTKYFNFFGDIINSITNAIAHSRPVPALQILMPLGISYYTLMGISYIVDVYRKTAKPEKNPLMLMLFLCYFPHIVEGPFDRYDSLCSQLRAPHHIDYQRIKNSGIRLVWGFFKKLVVADRAGLIVSTVFAEPGTYSGSVQLLAVILYTLQIYAEFSGCMDIVCGASGMFGIDIAENFRRPFFSRSISEFWRRWHITLGEWLKDYVFYPVSLSGHFRKINTFVKKHVSSGYLTALIPGAYALFFVWFCNGLWHGASVKYIVYGLYYYVLMMLGQALRPFTGMLMQRLHVPAGSRAWHVFEMLRTCAVVCFGMLIFRASGLRQAASMFCSIFTNFDISQLADGTLLFKGVTSADYILLMAAAALLLCISIIQEKGISVRETIGKQCLPVRWTLYFTLIFSVIILGAYGGSFANTTFIYGEF